MKCDYCTEEAPAFVDDVCYACVEWAAADGHPLDPTPPRMTSAAISKRMEETKVLLDEAFPGFRVVKAYGCSQSWVDSLTVDEWASFRRYRAMEQEVEQLRGLLYIAREHERRAAVHAAAQVIRDSKTKAAS